MRILAPFLLLLLAACSLQPVYSGGNTGGAQTTLGAIEVSPIPEKTGFLVRDRLLQRMPASEVARYRLDVVLDADAPVIAYFTGQGTTPPQPKGTVK